MNKDNKKTVCSFFTGAGGLDLGLEGDFSFLNKTLPPTSFKTIFACDILKPAKTAFDKFWKTRDGITINSESIVDLVKKATIQPDVLPKADIVTGGFPCQDFSLAGKRGGFYSHKNHKGEKIFGSPEENEGRGMLYYWLVKSVEIIKPKVFIAENVKGLLSIDGAVERIKQDFSKLGYVVQVKLLYAPDFGVPQKRERIIFIGIRKDLVKNKDVLNKVTVGEISLHPQPLYFKDRSPKYINCKQALKGLKEPNESNDLSQQSYSKAKFLEKGQGQKEVDLDGQSPTIRAEHHGNIEFRRLSKSHGGKHSDELKSGLKERRLTVRECARLQTFPDNYEFVSEDLGGSSAYKIIGNAVPPLLGYALAKRLEELWPILFE